jgi:hypothetical protein
MLAAAGLLRNDWPGFLTGWPLPNREVRRLIEARNNVLDSFAHFHRRSCCATAQTRSSPKSCARAAGR